MHIVYKVTNNFNNKYYIGVQNRHVPGGYLGSGKAITKAVKKYGKENFTKVVLHECKTALETYKLEGEIVTKKLVDDPNCYNMTLGGKIPPDQTGRKMPPRSKAYLKKQRDRKIGSNNPRNYCKWVTPWGQFDSARLAQESAPEEYKGLGILNTCKNNSKVINNLSIARSKGALKKEHLGKTYRQLGFSIILN